MRVNEYRRAKSGKRDAAFFCFIPDSYTGLFAGAFLLFVSRIPFTRICSQVYSHPVSAP
ncbi:hypothetical protein VCRA2121O68_90023 [Vibrio crassostreae]|nr:hypothetical protein VCRA2116O31_100199 [Vibrio crassostreae]CAK2014486.1 hypothetical protein VCRA2110O4_350021 [Vibrio crassostreae]CAK2020979.1 hypothetical protein VCRA2110O1_360019 [Vibrio crassostreae]CAK2263860.1 hypothetical protein VCRA2119O45_90022 [Vibrio crassostreae]CAK2389352.1 hypothetical protein VCRA2119O49_90023 [Vibrio crassostreae]